MLIPNLRTIEIDDIQLIRFWRNLDHINSRMVIKDVIDFDTQRNWFESLNPEKTKYYIYSYEKKDIGLATISKIDYKNKTFEGGIQCGDTNYLGHWINIWACIKIYNLAFFDLKMETAFAKILSNNDSALRLNKTIGYEFTSEVENGVGKYSLTKKNFINKSKKIQSYLKSLDSNL